MEIGNTGGDPRQRLIVPVPDEVRREIWRREARGQLDALLKNWQKADDELIRAIIEAMDRWRETGSIPPCPTGGAHEWGIDGAHSNEYCKKCFRSKTP